MTLGADGAPLTPLHNPKGSGLKLVAALARQIGGTVRLVHQAQSCSSSPFGHETMLGPPQEGCPGPSHGGIDVAAAEVRKVPKVFGDQPQEGVQCPSGWASEAHYCVEVRRPR